QTAEVQDIKASSRPHQGFVNVIDVFKVSRENHLFVTKLDNSIGDIQQFAHNLVVVILSGSQKQVGVLDNHQFLVFRSQETDIKIIRRHHLLVIRDHSFKTVAVN